MNYIHLIYRSLRYYWRTQLGVFLGVIISTAILTGALMVGDSVRLSLKDISLSKIGKTEYAMVTQGHFFRNQLCSDMNTNEIITAPLIYMEGVATADNGEKRANKIHVYGVDKHFWQFSSAEMSPIDIPENSALLNSRLAEKLHLKIGDEFILRIPKAGAVPLDIPFLSVDSSGVSMRLKISSVLDAEQFGDFSLGISQSQPFNVFLPLKTLSNILNHKTQANLMLISSKNKVPVSLGKLKESLKEHWRLEDAGLHLSIIPGNKIIELKSDRIFIDNSISDVALQCGKGASGILTYFVNSIRNGEKSTPYSFISAPAIFPENESGVNTEQSSSVMPLLDNEIIITQWLADDLHAKLDDTIQLTYFVIGPYRRLIEKKTQLKVKKVIPQPDNVFYRSLIPDFPGLSDTDNCKNWDPSLPVDISKIRDKDEKYWEKYGGTPKAFVSLSCAQKMWENRFGDLTAIRYSGGRNDIGTLKTELWKKLDPLTTGFKFIPIRNNALTAVNNSIDFGQLFIGLSFFLIVSSLLLTGMLFVFTIENRTDETGTLLSIGFSTSTVKHLLLAEGLSIVVPGSILGVICGILYNRFILFALSNFWHGAVGAVHLQPYVVPNTLLSGFITGIVIAGICMWVVLRKQGRKNIAELHSTDYSMGQSGTYRKYLNVMICSLSMVTALLFLFTTPFDGGRNVAGIFFGIGTLLLISFLTACNILLHRLGTGNSVYQLKPLFLILRNCSRRRGRSLTVISLIATGVFVVIAVSANRHNPFIEGNPRNSGTGGFSLYCETTLPVVEDINSVKGRKKYGLDSISDPSLSFVQLRLKPGDDASCLNLNRVKTPGIIGVDPNEFTKRKAFSFVSLNKDINRHSPWVSALEYQFPDDKDTIPAVADQGVIMWGLGKKIGDTLTYTDSRGQPFKLKLVGGISNSIFQGRILISEKNFIKKFPGINGSKIILVDSSANSRNDISEKLSFAMTDKGIDVIPTDKRLNDFSTVENTYLSVFLALGALGVILGTFGLGIVVMRNILERRRELAILRAVGFSRKEIFNTVFIEHCFLLSIGLISGTAAGIMAVLPVIFTSGTNIPFFLLGSILVLIFFIGAIAVFLGTLSSIHGKILSSLHNE